MLSRALVAEAARRRDLAEVARLDPLHGFLQPLARADLRAGLHDPLYFFAAFTSCRPSQMLCETGFSTYTSLPACIAQIAASECQWFGVAIVTASMSLFASSHHGGVGLCLDHLVEARTYRVGGTIWACPHGLPRVKSLRGAPAGIAGGARHTSAAR